MNAPGRAETITAEELTEFEYAGYNYLAAKFSDGSTHVLNISSNGAIVDSGEIYISLPDSCSGEMGIDRNWDEIPSDSIDAFLEFGECTTDEQQDNQIYLSIDIRVGNTIFRRPAIWETANEVINPSVDEFVKL